MVCAVVPSNGFTAISQSEVLIAITARNDKMVGFWRDVGGCSAMCGVTPLKASLKCAAVLRLIT